MNQLISVLDIVTTQEVEDDGTIRIIFAAIVVATILIIAICCYIKERKQ